MAITETTSPAATETQVNPWDADADVPAVADVFGSGDHKTLGRLWIGFALLFGLVSWGLQALVSVTAVADDLIPAEHLAQVFSGDRIGLVLLFALPLFVGLATCVVPLQVGASTVAFPRAAAAAFWSWLLGASLAIVGYAIDGGVGGTSATGVDLTYLGLALAIVALLLAVVCLLTTVVALRTTGMALDRVPLFSWSVLVAGSIWMLSLPALLANMLLIYLDQRYGAPSEFGVAELQWSQLSWAFQQPQIFVLAIPVLGAIGDIVVTTAGTRQARRGVVLGGIAAFGILSYGAWAQPFFNEGVAHQALYVGMGVLIGLPLLVVAGGLATTLRAGGRASLGTAFLGAALAVLTLLLAALASLLYVIRPLDLTETPFFQEAVLVLVLGAVTLGGIAALHHWAPKAWGRLAHDGLGRLAVLLAFLGAVVAGLALAVSGFQARFDALADASDALQVVATIGAGLLVLAIVVTVLSLLGRGGGAPDDPWHGQTLEWATTSPPAPGNFGTLAPVTSPEPLFDLEATKEDAP
jgi:heme/copper-type cytochrome/quinol oxidase subunit 1